MRKINKVGEELVEFYRELRKDYPELVKKSLVNTLQQMLNNDVIDLSTFDLLKSENLNEESFLSLLMENKRYVKSESELLKESEAIRENLNKILSAENLTKLFTESHIEDDEIYVCKTFTIDENFVMEFFGVSETEIPRLMSRKGFVETFVALRLVKVILEIIRETSRTVEKISIGNSLAYVDETDTRYNIDLVMRVSLEDLTKETEKERVLRDIKTVESVSERIYRQKMIC